ncbi:UNVERIFIED_CONTAM: hypothetical protein K2H54_059017 [Gekko kuhli]
MGKTVSAPPVPRADSEPLTKCLKKKKGRDQRSLPSPKSKTALKPSGAKSAWCRDSLSLRRCQVDDAERRSGMRGRSPRQSRSASRSSRHPSPSVPWVFREDSPRSLLISQYPESPASNVLILNPDSPVVMLEAFDMPPPWYQGELHYDLQPHREHSCSPLLDRGDSLLDNHLPHDPPGSEREASGFGSEEPSVPLPNEGFGGRHAGGDSVGLGSSSVNGSVC